MSRIASQDIHRVQGNLKGLFNICTSVVIAENGTDTVTLPRMSSTSGCVAQVQRPGDSTVTVTQSSATLVTLTNATGARVAVVLVSIHDCPIPNPVGDGA